MPAKFIQLVIHPVHGWVYALDTEGGVWYYQYKEGGWIQLPETRLGIEKRQRRYEPRPDYSRADKDEAPF